MYTILMRIIANLYQTGIVPIIERSASILLYSFITQFIITCIILNASIYIVI